MSADRRTLIIAASAMVALIAVGVVSSALFTASACDAIDPSPVELTAHGADVAAATEQALPELDADGRGQLHDEIDALADLLGPVSSVHALPDPVGLAATGLGLVATGPTTAVVDGPDAASAVEVGEATVVGDGDALFGLALVNPLTGQVDALQPIATGTAEGAALAGLTCQDTATVGTPLAFYLDAGGGELALLRADEDGEDAILELRDPLQGRVWAARLELSRAPAGIQGEWLTAGLGEEVVVTGYRTDPDDAEVPVLSGFDRSDGAPRWALTREDLSDAIFDDRPDRVEVVAVGTELAVVTVQAEDVDADPDPDATEPATTGPVTLVGIGPRDGQVRFVERLDDASLDDTAVEDAAGDHAGVSDVLVDGRNAWIAVADDGHTQLLEADEAGTSVRHRIDGSVANLTRGGDGAVTAVGDAVVAVVTDQGLESTPISLAASDVLAVDGRVSVVFDAPDGQAAVVVGFGG